MNQYDDELRRLLNHAVNDVDPHEGLTAITSKTKEKKMPARRPVLFGAGGAAVATAAVIGVIAWSGGFGSDDPDDAQPAGAPSSSAPASSDEPSVDESPSTEPDDPADTHAVPVYFVGDGPNAPVLFREFQQVRAVDEVVAAVETAINGTPDDPDLRTAWPEGTQVLGFTHDDGDSIQVDLAGDVTELPEGVTERDGMLAVQQLAYSAQAARGNGAAKLELTVDGSPVDSVLGVDTTEPITAAPQLDVLSHVMITTPETGQTVSGKFEATGLINNFEANVPWEIRRDGEVVEDGADIAEDWLGEKLFPFTVEIDVSDLEPGEYEFRVHTDDPTGGNEGPGGEHVDTKVFTVE